MSRTPVSALVVLRPAVPGSVDAGAPIDRSNLAGAVPSDDDVERVAAALHELGFEVGPMVGVSMSITASRRRFETALHVRLVEVDGGWAVGDDGDADRRRPAADDGSDRAVPLDALPAGVADRIDCITFESPRELHDGDPWSF